MSYGVQLALLSNFPDFRGAVLGAHSEVEPQASPFVPDFPTATERPVRNVFLGQQLLRPACLKGDLLRR